VLIRFTVQTNIASPPPRTGPLKIVKSSTGKIDAMLAEPPFTACLGGLGATVLAGSPTDVGKLIADETEKLGQGDPSK
jgi:hypothetical protein